MKNPFYHVIELDDGHGIGIDHVSTLTRYQVQTKFSAIIKKRKLLKNSAFNWSNLSSKNANRTKCHDGTKSWLDMPIFIRTVLRHAWSV